MAKLFHSSSRRIASLMSPYPCVPLTSRMLFRQSLSLVYISSWAAEGALPYTESVLKGKQKLKTSLKNNVKTLSSGKTAEEYKTV